MSPRFLRTVAGVALIAALAIASSACGTAKADKNAPDPADSLTIVVPATLADLTVTKSEKATTTLVKAGAGANNYQKDAQVFELRKGKELQAVLQITRLTADAHPELAEFRRQIIQSSQLNASREPVRFGDTDVYKATLNRQHIFIWFHSKFMEILMVRSDSITLAQQGAINVTQLVTEVANLMPTPA